MSIEPTNLTAQLYHRAAGNPPSTLADAAISNCFPGLEFDFRNAWRRVFEGIEVHEANGLVTSADAQLQRLVGLELVQVDDVRVLLGVRGPRGTQEDVLLATVSMEWSNALARILSEKVGQLVTCRFAAPAASPEPDPPIVATARLRVRPLMARSEATDAPLALLDEHSVHPGELTQSLCSPWQNDYQECACFYWAASRPDYVDREHTAAGTLGAMWLGPRSDPPTYDPAAAYSHEELFRDWENLLRFIVGGRDAE